MKPSFTQQTDLANQAFGGQILFATDEWFAAADNLIAAHEPTFDPNTFTEYGKEMDGWESRRKRTAGHDWCVIRLGLPGDVHGVTVDTAFFTGNQTPRVSIQFACLDDKPHLPLKPGSVNFQNDPEALCGLRTGKGIGTCASKETLVQAELAATDKWEELIPFTALQPGYEETRMHYFEVPESKRTKITHVRVNYFPDGGVARMRFHGVAHINPSDLPPVFDLAAAEFGGIALSSSNAHYGTPSNLIAPGRAINMGGGWETARNPNRPAEFRLDVNGHLESPGCDWAVLKLTGPGVVKKIEIDTNHFKGNFPESCEIMGCYAPESSNSDFDSEAKLSKLQWRTILPRVKLGPNEQVLHSEDVVDAGPVTHVRLTIYPDGGISRLRLFGTLDEMKAKL